MPAPRPIVQSSRSKSRPKGTLSRRSISTSPLCAPVQSRENRITLWRISFQGIGTGRAWRTTRPGGKRGKSHLKRRPFAAILN